MGVYIGIMILGISYIVYLNILKGIILCLFLCVYLCGLSNLEKVVLIFYRVKFILFNLFILERVMLIFFIMWIYIYYF